jgi:membrane-associated phospholipid phosphatase
VDPGFGTALLTPNSPAYPSATAAAAGAAAAVLAYLFPERARAFADMADEAAESRIVAGLNYRSDVAAGRALGFAVAARAVERGRSDRSDAVWTGSVPVGPGRWQGTNPVLPMAGTWRSWTLARADAFRPPAPPAFDSPQMAADLAELRAVQRTPAMTSAAWFWEMAAGGARAYAYWNELLRRKLFEHRLDGNPPRTVRAFALATIAHLDAVVACWEAKFTYWQIRPPQLDPNLHSLFPPPNHPSYPAAHGALSTASAAALAHIFPADAAMFEALAAEAAEARVWAGIHYRSDIVAGRTLGRKVGERAIAVALGEAPRP